ncbi:MAG: hypothetical protein ACR2NZ_09865 [Rubripirellula sp.]
MTTCALAAMLSTGCRSMSGKSMFSMRGEPSAEVLAGSGPTTTYPVPPSESATPEAIASIAGGTSSPVTAPQTATASMTSPLSGKTAQVAGVDISPGYATPANNVAQAPNMAAAQANGIYGGSATQSAGFTAPSSPAAKPAGYTFGSKALTPKAAPTAPGTEFAMSDAVSAGSTSATQASGFTPPKPSFAPPATTDAYTSPPVAATSSSPSGGQGFTFPTDSPAMAAIVPPKSDINGFESPAVDEPAATEILPPAAVSPEFSTASAAPSVTAPSTSSIDVSPPASGSTSYEGYTPGSTGAATGYPSGGETPNTSGSFYR